MKKRTTLILTAMLSTVMALAACGEVAEKETGGGAASPTPSASASSASPSKSASSSSPLVASSGPVTLNVLWSGPKSSFDERVANDIVKQKLPNITAKFYSKGDIDKLLTEGVKLDVMNVTTAFYYDIRRYQLNYDMLPVIKQENFDLSRFVPEQLEAIKGMSKNGKMDAVPDKAFPYAMYGVLYNKDIFDKFGVPYPTDNMTWDQILALAKRLNRDDGGVKYYGIQMAGAPDILHASGINYTDDKGIVNVSDPLYPRVLQLERDAYDITGKVEGPVFLNNQAAMYVGNIEGAIEGFDPRLKKNIANWDIVTFPHFEGKPLTVPPAFGVYMIASTSEHKVEALQLIDALLSKENTKKIEDSFINPLLDKNINAVKAPKQAIYVTGEFDYLGNSLLGNVINDMNEKKTDINTALDSFKEQLQKQIAEKLKQ